jgi:DNA-binding LytR/AlgR family response regulator
MKNKTVVLNKNISINYNDIVHIQSNNNGSIIVLFNNTIHESILSIDYLEWELPKDIFIRVHPNHIINKDFFNKYYTETSKWVQLQNGEKIPVSNKLFQNKNQNILNKFIKKYFYLKNRLFKSKIIKSS